MSFKAYKTQNKKTLNESSSGVPQEKMKKLDGVARYLQKVKASATAQPQEKSATPDTSTLDVITKDNNYDGVAAIMQNKKEEKKATNKASSSKTATESKVYPEQKNETIMDILARVDENRNKRYKGATPPQKVDDNWSDNQKKLADIPVVVPDETNIDKINDKNSKEISKSLPPKAKGRPKDSKVGDKKPKGVKK